MGLLRMKRLGEKICMVTAHDYPSAAHVGAAGVDVALCGDSLGMVALGYADTRPVTLDEMLHHCRAARRGLGAVGDAPLLVLVGIVDGMCDELDPKTVRGDVDDEWDFRPVVVEVKTRVRAATAAAQAAPWALLSVPVCHRGSPTLS